MKKLFFISLGLVLILNSLFLIPGSAFAAGATIEPTKLIVPIPVGGKDITEIPDPGQYIRYIYMFGLSIGGLLGMAIIVYAAIERILSAGNESKIKDANDRITQAAIGLILLFGAYIILQAIGGKKLTSLTLPSLRPVTLPKLENKSFANTILEMQAKLKKEEEENKLALQKAEADLEATFKKAEASKTLQDKLEYYQSRLDEGIVKINGFHIKLQQKEVETALDKKNLDLAKETLAKFEAANKDEKTLMGQRDVIIEFERVYNYRLGEIENIKNEIEQQRNENFDFQADIKRVELEIGQK